MKIANALSILNNDANPASHIFKCDERIVYMASGHPRFGKKKIKVKVTNLHIVCLYAIISRLYN